jgi:hypothetical protein
MKPELAQFGSSSPISIVTIDIDQKSSPDYLKYKSKMTSRSIPFSVLLDSKGEVVHQISGFRTSADLQKETKKFIK